MKNYWPELSQEGLDTLSEGGALLGGESDKLSPTDDKNFRNLHLGEFLPNNEMITLQYYNGKEWVDCGEFDNEQIAWISLGGDDMNYRTALKQSGIVLTDKSV
jgi:hypothetical protein